MYYKLDIIMRTMPSGAYAVIDKDGDHCTNYDLHHLLKSFDDNNVNQPLLPVKHANIIEQLPAENGVLALNTTFPDPSGIPHDLISSAFLAGTTRPASVGIQKFEWLSDKDHFVATWSDNPIENTDWMPPRYRLQMAWCISRTSATIPTNTWQLTGKAAK